MKTQQTHDQDNTGELDPEFGVGGMTELLSPDPDFTIYTSRVVAVGPDNLIYVAGLAKRVPIPQENKIFIFTRLDNSGHLDPTFGKQGYVTGWFGSKERPDVFYPRDIQFHDDKLFLIGEVHHYKQGELRLDCTVLCYHLNGEPDEDFADHGRFISNLPRGAGQSAQLSDYHETLLKNDRNQVSSGPYSTINSGLSKSVFTLSDEHLLLVHYQNSQSFIIRLTLRGALDKTFNGTGYVGVRHDAYASLILHTLIIDNNGNYIAGGHARHESGHPPDAVVLIKYNPTGNLDTSFQQNGFLTITPEDGETYLYLQQLENQPNNRILCIGGEVNKNSGKTSGLLISREADGSKNIQFNGGNPVITKDDSSNLGWYTSRFQSDGKFLISGWGGGSSLRERYYVVSRFGSDGKLDISFGNGKGWLNFNNAPIALPSTAFMANKVLFQIRLEQGDYIARGITTPVV